MPSGKTHDLITLILAVPTFVAAWFITKSILLSSITTGAMLFGGLMFGPDLDIYSRQYTRWGIFRFLWVPYQVMFGHRSRWSHGIIFGTIIRVIYFAGVLAILFAAGVYLRALFVSGGSVPAFSEVINALRTIETTLAEHDIDRYTLLATFVGLWLGAASHTISDVLWSIIRKASEIF